MTFKDKKALYGNARILPSGRPEGDADLAGSGEKRVSHVRKDSDIEPVCYQGLHRNVWEELLNQAGNRDRLKCIIDLTPADHTLALIAIEAQIPYIGVVFNEFHMAAIQKHLTKQVFQKYLHAKSKLHIPKLAAMMQPPPQQGTGSKSGTPGDAEASAGPKKRGGDDGEGPASAPKKSKKQERGTDDARAALLGALGASVGGPADADDDEATVED